YFWELEPMIRAIASEMFSRGKLEISIRVQRTSQPEYNVRINAAIANAVIPQLRAMADEHGVAQTFSGGDLLRIPDLLQVDAVDAEIEEGEREALGVLLRGVLEQLRLMRSKEGEALRDDVAARIGTIRTLQDDLSAHRDDIRKESFDAFQARVNEIANAAGIQIDHDRIAQEVVMMIEKGDIAEELTRLSTHVIAIEAAMKGKEAAGKKLDFLSQEMLREINTMGSKSRAASIRSLVVELKTEVERIREQVQNVE
ncbi:MAG: hypothetical protein JWO56_3448, partial [Acidobacteria bacterium]|nr:hypothetical protein [Acidobacteriota bacterium]